MADADEDIVDDITDGGSQVSACYDKDLHDRFLFIPTCTDTGVIATHALIFLPASGPIVLVDSHAAHCCDSELRLTVHYCAL